MERIDEHIFCHIKYIHTGKAFAASAGGRRQEERKKTVRQKIYSSQDPSVESDASSRGIKRWQTNHKCQNKIASKRSVISMKE